MRGPFGFILAISTLIAGALLVLPIAVALPSPVLASTDLSVEFPEDPRENASAALANEIASRLGLGIVLSVESFVNPLAFWFDGLNNSVPLTGAGAPVAPQKIISATTSGGLVVELSYNASSPPDESNGSFLFAEIRPFPGNVSASPAEEILRSVASSLGIALDGTEHTREYAYGRYVANDSLSATLYRSINGTPVGFANQVALRAWTTNGTIEVVRVFPWVSPPAGPLIDPDEGFVLAVSYANASVDPGVFTLSSWEYRGFALDPRVYRLAYSYFLSYVGSNITEYGTLHFLFWIDVETGEVLLFDWVRVVPGTAAPVPGGLILTYAIGLAVGAAALLVAAGLVRSESARYALFSFLTVAFLSVRRDRALEHFVRGQIYEYLRSHPGATFSDIRDHLSLNNGTAAHHLMVLEKMEFVVSKREGRLKHFFRGDTPNRIVSISLSPLQYEILNALAQEELTQAELVARLGVSRQRVSRNVRALQVRRVLTSGARRGGLRMTPYGQSMLERSPPGASEG